MPIAINSRILLSAASIAAAAALVIGATFAFFSDTEISTGNTLTAGTLDIEITDQNSDDPFQDEILVTNWAPGEQRFVNFDVKNFGSLPVNLRGFATGTWGDPDLDSENRVKVVQVERWDGATWANVQSNPSGITGYFYWSPDGTNNALYTLNSGDRAQLRLTVEFDAGAGDNFQGEIFTASLQAEAKQTNAPSF
jgi:predicted ribosomally synthesized peptide with SipW-like signal peptide